ncbi:MAG: molybdenum cofactor biosynthesis protein MoaE [Pseudomonadota bacterium]
MTVEIRPEDYDPWVELSRYQARSDRLQPGAFGACASFVGTMRDFSEGDNVSSMTLEYYPGMTEKQLNDLVEGAIANHELIDALILHRVGEVRPGDAIVLVATWSAHRKASFDACRLIMEHLKSQAPFWKKEQLSDSERWVESNTSG